MADLRERVLDVLRNEGADIAETIGALGIMVGALLLVTTLPLPLGILISVGIAVRIYRRAEDTAELDRYRRGKP